VAAEVSFSVVIPVYNGERTVGRAIQSVLEQSHPALEVIVVNDGSTDGTGDVLSAFGDRIRVLNMPNRGVSAARNTGVESARGDWLAFLDADDWYFPDRLKCHADLIASEPEIDFVTGDFEYRSDDGRLLGRSMERTALGRSLCAGAAENPWAILERDDFGEFVESHFGDTHTLSLPRTTFRKLEGYSTAYRVCEDVHLLVRLCAVSRRAGVICRPLAVYLIRPDSATRTDRIEAQRETVRAMESLERTLTGSPPMIREGVRRGLRHARLDLAYALLRERHRMAAVSAVLPLLRSGPMVTAVRDVLSVVRG